MANEVKPDVQPKATPDAGDYISLTLGILSILLLWLPVGTQLVAIPALILAIRGVKRGVKLGTVNVWLSATSLVLGLLFFLSIIVMALLSTMAATL